jgi:hypothetical protein
VRLWEAKSGACMRTLRAERRYERMDISGLIGITAAQRASLIALGAVERPLDRAPALASARLSATNQPARRPEVRQQPAVPVDLVRRPQHRARRAR